MQKVTVQVNGWLTNAIQLKAKVQVSSEHRDGMTRWIHAFNFQVGENYTKLVHLKNQTPGGFTCRPF